MKQLLALLKKRIDSLRSSLHQRFYLIIGDDGAILILTHYHQVKARFFVNGCKSEDIIKFTTLLREHPTIPIYIFLDVLEQNYHPYSLPPVSTFNIKSLVKKRLERDFPGNLLRGGYFLSKAKTGRKDWNYLFASCPVSTNIEAWLEYLYPFANNVHSLHLLPLEVEKIACHPRLHAIYTTQPDEERWEIMMLHHKVSGFRQIAFKNGKMVFTRLVSLDENEVPEVLAGNIEQELQNSLEFIRRLATKEIKRFNIMIVVDKKAGTHIDQTRLAPNFVSIFTPFEFAQLLEAPNAATDKDKYSEITIAAVCAKGKSILPLHLPITQWLFYLYHANRFLRYMVLFCVPYIALSLTSSLWDLYNSGEDLKILSLAHDEVEQSWNRLQQKYDLKGKDVQQMQDMVALYHLMVAPKEDPIALWERFSKTVKNEIKLREYTWKFDNKDDLNDHTVMEKHSPHFTSNFSILYKNPGTGFDSLFNSFEAFIHRLEGEFKAYNLKYSRPEQQINFGDNSNEIPVQIGITSKTGGEK